jgi:hypothetical protein
VSTSTWVDALVARASWSAELLAWARTQPDLQTAWASCERLDWQIELGVALAVDDTTQRALVTAGVRLILDEPWLLRLRPAGFRIAEAWALRQNAGYLDLIGTRRFEDSQNAIVVTTATALALLLLLQVRFHAPHSVLAALAAAAVPACYVVGRLWGIARVRLTERAIADYRFERVERDVLRHGRWLARKAPAPLQKSFAERFRRGWQRVADFPAPALSGSSG